MGEGLHSEGEVAALCVQALAVPHLISQRAIPSCSTRTQNPSKRELAGLGRAAASHKHEQFGSHTATAPSHQSARRALDIPPSLPPSLKRIQITLKIPLN